MPSICCRCHGAELPLCDATHWKSKTPLLGHGGWELVPGFSVEHANWRFLFRPPHCLEKNAVPDGRQADRISRTY
jgi:hypothetical protein